MPTSSRPRRRSDRRDRAAFVLSDALRRAIWESPRTLTALAFPFGFTASNLSSLIHGQRFGPRRRARIVELGASLGVPADACTREVER